MRTEKEIRAMLAQLKKEAKDASTLEYLHRNIIRDVKRGGFIGSGEDYLESLQVHDNLIWQIELLEWTLGKFSSLFELEEEVED